MKKIKILLPFFIIPIIIPVYSFLDSKYFVKVFGCGCVMKGEYPNSLGNYFNVNDLRMLVFAVLAIAAILLGGFISRKFPNEVKVVLYNVCTVCLNILYWHFVVTNFIWK